MVRLEPLTEVEGALLVVEVLHAPHPKLLGLLLVGGEHFFCGTKETEVSIHTTCGQLYTRGIALPTKRGGT
jgi:hypothetical protein